MKTATIRVLVICLLAALLAVSVASSQDMDSVPYVRTSGFNAPALLGWEDQSSQSIAQFQLPSAQASIRTAMVAAEDPLLGARADLAAWLGVTIGEPVFSHKVNLADGTWHTLVFDIDAETTASLMARRAGTNVVVISFVESTPDSRTVMLTLPQADAERDDAQPEMALALAEMGGLDLNALDAAGTAALPSGDWLIYENAELRVMGMVFGNDSYIALQSGQLGDLASLADAYNRALLGFFITPDNSLYLALGLAVSFAILGLLFLSWLWRARQINKDLAMLSELAE